MRPIEACHLDPSQELQLELLICELGRLDTALRRAVAHWQQAGRDPNDPFRGLYISDQQVQSLLQQVPQRPWAGSEVQALGDLTPGDGSREQDSARRLAELRRKIEALGRRPRLQQLQKAFALSPFEMQVILFCLAPALDLRYQRIYAYLQDDVTRKQPSVSLILDLICPQATHRLQRMQHFLPSAPLRAHGLIRLLSTDPPARSLLSQSIQIEPAVMAWLLGSYTPLGPLASCAHLHPPVADELQSLAAQPYSAQLEPAARRGALLALVGRDSLRRRMVAADLARRMGRTLLRVDLRRAADPPGQVIAAALRDARLLDATTLFEGWDGLLEQGEAPANAARLIAQHPATVILSATELWHPGAFGSQCQPVFCRIPPPDYTLRLHLWHQALENAPLPAGLDQQLAGRFALTCRQILNAAGSAALEAQAQGKAIEPAHLFKACRRQSGSRLAALARKIEPRFQWDDLILPQDQKDMLRELVHTVLARSQVLEAWGAGRKLAPSAGITALFSGPPGTGKTMAAEIIAGELELDLYKIDLSSVVSKYIGETEKNLDRIFREAASSNAILFFDEADALFGKRSEVRDSHDRYANIEISYLLQRMEAYEGVTILATNLRSNLDEAFTRRIQFAVDFPLPEEQDRLRIWQTLFPPQVPRQPGLDLALLARRFKLAGGNIRNIILSAAYLAAADGGVVTLDHLLHGARRELQKMGRWVEEETAGASASPARHEENHGH